MTRDRTCAERIAEHQASRIAQIGALNDLASIYSETRRDEVLEDKTSRDELKEIGFTADSDPDDISEAARERLYELPLAIDSYRVFRIHLSTGGPADYLDVKCSGDPPVYEPGDNTYEIDQITYHFADWFDHAEQALEREEFETAAEFARNLIPELID